jgi:trk system potassium uptake protein TrkH
MLNRRVILNIIGMSVILESVFMLFPVLVSVIYDEPDLMINLKTFGITLIAGLVIWLSGQKHSREIGRKDAYFIVPVVWIVFAAFGALPYYLGHYVSTYTDAFFEAISGFTTTGASIMTDIEALPHGILFWRSLTHLIGGMGILIMFIAILPFLGVGGMQLFHVESVGLQTNKLRPRVRETARMLWVLYISLVALETLFLVAGRMPLFDALCHSFGTIATGGFSTKNASIGAYSSYIQYVVLVFMILAGINFTLLLQFIRGRFNKPLHNPELRFYLMILGGAGLIITLFLVVFQHLPPSRAFREGFFQVTSIVTCTGFSTADYMQWTHHAWFFIFLLMFVGGSSGSTSGGIKVGRHLMFLNNLKVQYQRLLHPRAVINVRIGDESVTPELMSRTFAFFVLYIFTFAAGSLILVLNGLDTTSAMGAAATTMGGIGPGLGSVGPASNFAALSVTGKWVLSALMLLGRLELFAVLILFTRTFWKNQ